MNEQLTDRLFWLAVGRSPQPEPLTVAHDGSGRNATTDAYLADYRLMLDALALPAFLIDQGWNIKMANRAYDELFQATPAHPTAMPGTNFLRYGLFHPHASRVLVEHRTWQLAMLAQLSSSLERYSQDATLQAARRDVFMHPALRDMYLKDLPAWAVEEGGDLVHHDTSVRELRHPDPAIGLKGCRLVAETPRLLQALCLTRITLVLTGTTDGTTERGGIHDHHNA